MELDDYRAKEEQWDPKLTKLERSTLICISQETSRTKTPETNKVLRGEDEMVPRPIGCRVRLDLH